MKPLSKEKNNFKHKRRNFITRLSNYLLEDCLAINIRLNFI